MNMIIEINRQQPELAELTLPANLLQDTAFKSGTAFRVEQDDNGLTLSLIGDEEGEWDDWVQQDGSLYLAGSWLEQGGLANQAKARVTLFTRQIQIEPATREAPAGDDMLTE